jgi:hypothetical protein
MWGEACEEVGTGLSKDDLETGDVCDCISGSNSADWEKDMAMIRIVLCRYAAKWMLMTPSTNV